MTAMVDRELRLPTDEQATRDRKLIEALDQHQSVGEKYARTGEAPIVLDRAPWAAGSSRWPRSQ